MKELRFSLLLSLLPISSGLVGCTSFDSEQTRQWQPYGHLDVPADFLARYPPGTQNRQDQDIERVILKDRTIDAVFASAGSALRGEATLAIAVDPNGVVEAVSIISSNLTDEDIAERLAQKVFKLRFGPAQGDGNYDFTFKFRSSGPA